MSKIAIDIVLLPSEEMMEKVIEINKELVKTNGKKIVFNKKTCIPHITLAMGCIDEGELHDLKNMVPYVAEEFFEFNLTAETIVKGKNSSQFSIKNTVELQRLHEILLKRLQQFSSYDADASMFLKPDETEKLTIDYVKNYIKTSTGSNFKPHITIGVGDPGKIKLPIEFTASTVAVCPLGNYCTCGKVFFSKNLD